MRKHGWQLPYHPLQVVAVAVFLALGFAFYVFFAPFVGKKLFQYIVMGLYSPLIVCVIGLYIWCAASDPADPGVFKSKKYIRVADNNKSAESKESKLGGDSVQDANAAQTKKKIEDSHQASRFSALLRFLPCAFVCNCSDQRESSSEQTSEDGMFYCSLCEVEVFKYSKHCRVCDKCVDRFDHHCRWLNNCVGKRNYRKFFTLMVSALLLLILQWSTGILVLIRCFIENKRFYAKITSNLGSSFSVAPFVIVVAVCTILAMIATLPIAQLFFFHILLIKKGISTYDYIMALREQEQQGQQSPQMSTVSSLTGLSSASSMSTFRRAAWCTPPPLFLEDQFDVVPPDNASVSSRGRKTLVEEPVKKKNPAPVKINPWTLARLNAEDVSKAAAEARKKSKILQPVVKQQPPRAPEANKRRPSKRVRLPAELPFENLTQLLNETGQRSRGMMITETSSRNAFATVVSSPESSLDSPDIHPLRVSSSGAEDARHLAGGLSTLSGYTIQKEIPLSSSTSDGYDASGGEDSDRVPSRFVQRLAQWSGPESRLVLPSSSSSSLQANNRRR